MVENGPLIHFWAMPFERKHQDSKRVAVSTASSKNLPMTIGIRNQLQLSYRVEYFTEPESDISIGPIKNNQVTAEVRKINVDLPNDISAKSLKYIEIIGKKYTENTIFFHGFKEDKILFLQLRNIYVIDEEIFLHTHSLTTLDFNDNYHAYEVEISALSQELIPINKIYRVPPCLFVKKDCRYYVAMRYDL